MVKTTPNKFTATIQTPSTVYPMDLETTLPSLYKRYVPRIKNRISVHQAAWIIANDPFLTDDERITLQNYAGSATPFAREDAALSNREWRCEMPYAPHTSCGHMTKRCACGACPVCVFVKTNFEECAHCTTAISRDTPETDPCGKCGFRTILCENCQKCIHCEDNACDKCTTMCVGCCEHVRCKGCKEIVDDICSRCGVCGDCCECAVCAHRRCGERVEHVCTRCDFCEDHCECSHCEHCGEPCEYTCENCNNCENHCDCCRCNECDGITYADRYCNECDRCRDCCVCDDEEEDDSEPDNSCIDAATGTFPANHIKHRRRFDCARLAGVEVEYNNCRTSEPIRIWKRKWRASVHEDSSCGQECVTSPAAGDFLVRQLEELASAMSDANAKTDRRCGIHVHVDARDLRWPEICRLANVYAKVEAALYLIAGQHRAHSYDDRQYCAPNGHRLRNALVTASVRHDRAKAALLTAIFDRDGVSVAQGSPEKKDRARYVGLNLCPWVSGRLRARNTRGKYRVNSVTADTTVEFRMHRDSMDATRIVGWAKLCTRIVDWCAKATDKDVSDLPESAMRALCVIAPDLAPWIMQRLCAWRKAVPRAKRRIAYRYDVSNRYWIRYSFQKDEDLEERAA